MISRIAFVVCSLILLACSSNPGNKPKAGSEKNNFAGALEPAKPNVQSEMVYFKGGTFQMGSATGTPQEQPVHEVAVQSFKLDKFPVTVGDFRSFIVATQHKTDAEKFGDSGVFDFKTNSWTLIQYKGDLPVQYGIQVCG